MWACVYLKVNDVSFPEEPRCTWPLSPTVEGPEGQGRALDVGAGPSRLAVGEAEVAPLELAGCGPTSQRPQRRAQHLGDRGLLIWIGLS